LSLFASLIIRLFQPKQCFSHTTNQLKQYFGSFFQRNERDRCHKMATLGERTRPRQGRLAMSQLRPWLPAGRRLAVGRMVIGRSVSALEHEPNSVIRTTATGGGRWLVPPPTASPGCIRHGTFATLVASESGHHSFYYMQCIYKMK